METAVGSNESVLLGFEIFVRNYGQRLTVREDGQAGDVSSRQEKEGGGGH